MSGIPPDNNSSREEEGGRRQDQQPAPPIFDFIDYAGEGPARSTEDTNESNESAVRQPRFAHFMFSFRSRLPHSREKATAAALSSLKRVPVAQVPEADRSCVICYEPLEDASEEQIEKERKEMEEREDTRQQDAGGSSGQDPLEPGIEIGRAFGEDEGDGAGGGDGGGGGDGATADAADGAPADAAGGAPADADTSSNAPAEPTSSHPCPNDHSPTQMPCSHIFGRSCLYSWLKGNTTCPICRSAVEGEDDVDGEQQQYQVLNLNLDVFLPEENRNVSMQEFLRDSTAHLPLVRLVNPDAGAQGAPTDAERRDSSGFGAAAAALAAAREAAEREDANGAEGSEHQRERPRRRRSASGAAAPPRVHIHHVRHPMGFHPHFDHGQRHQHQRGQQRTEQQDGPSSDHLPEMGSSEGLPDFLREAYRRHATHQAAHESAHEAIEAALDRIINPMIARRGTDQSGSEASSSESTSSSESASSSSGIDTEPADRPWIDNNAIAQALARAQSATQTQDNRNDLAYMYFERPGREQARQAAERAFTAERTTFLSLFQRMMRRGEEQRAERERQERLRRQEREERSRERQSEQAQRRVRQRTEPGSSSPLSGDPEENARPDTHQ